MRSVSVVINARLASSRLPRKLVKPFGGSSLIEKALDKLSRIKIDNKYLATCDPEIIELYKPYAGCISLLERDPRSVLKGMVPHTIAFQHYKNVPDDFILIMNPCHPFVDVLVYEAALDHFISGTSRSLTSVVMKNNIFFDDRYTTINGTACVEVQTHKQIPIYEMAHAFHIIDKSRFLSEGKLWGYKKDDPELFVVNKRSALDVDDFDDFCICEALWKRACKKD